MSYDTGVAKVGIIGADIINDVIHECDRAHALHNERSMLRIHGIDSLPVLMEEVGEVAKEMNEYSLGNRTQAEFVANLRNELTQVAAMAMTWMRKLDLKGEIPNGLPYE